MWSTFMPKIWELIASLNAKVLVGVLQGLGAILRGSHSLAIPELAPDSFLANLIELGQKLWNEFAKEENSANLFT